MTKKNIKVGDRLIFADSESGVRFAEAVATDVYEKEFGNINEPDKDGHERCEDDKEMYEVFGGYYRKNISSKSKLKIIKYILET